MWKIQGRAAGVPTAEMKYGFILTSAGQTNNNAKINNVQTSAYFQVKS